MKLWQWLGFGVVTLLGTILHFLYDWTGECPWIAPFSGVNESTWEHMKLLFFPLFVFALIEYRFAGENQRDFWCIKLSGTLLGLFLIPALYYGYTGAFGLSLDWLNIAIFFISAAIAYLYKTKLFNENQLICKTQKRALSTLVVIGMLFVIFTFLTPQIGIFRDPLTGNYGI